MLITEPPMRYAGFWKRFNAYGVDLLLLMILSWLVSALTGVDALAQGVTNQDIETLSRAVEALQTGQVDPALHASLIANLQNMLLTSVHDGSLIPFVNDYWFILLSAIYNIAFVAGEWQATPGKRWCGIKVVMKDGRKLTPLEAGIRHGISGISMLLGGLGYITLFFTREKLALHDMICNTRVTHGKTVTREDIHV